MEIQEAHRIDNMAVRLYVSHLIIEGTKTKALLLQAKTVVKNLQEENSTLMSQMAEKDRLLAKAIMERDEAIATRTCNFCINISEKELVSCTKTVGRICMSLLQSYRLQMWIGGCIRLLNCSLLFPGLVFSRTAWSMGHGAGLPCVSLTTFFQSPDSASCLGC